MDLEIKKKKILVVDDDPGIVVLLENKLTGLGYAVAKCSNGAEALSAIRQHIPDLIIMDRMMPKMDGIKVSALLKADKRFAKVPIIMFTASADRADQRLSEEVGVNCFLTKPFNTELLLLKTQELLGDAPLSGQ